LAGHEVDVLWPDRRLIVEVDGYAFHSSRTAFEKDRKRDAALQAAGYRVVRVTWRQLTERPEALSATLGAALAGDP
jgi:very-short-patch-repair endonuclease